MGFRPPWAELIANAATRNKVCLTRMNRNGYVMPSRRDCTPVYVARWMRGPERRTIVNGTEGHEVKRGCLVIPSDIVAMHNRTTKPADFIGFLMWFGSLL